MFIKVNNTKIDDITLFDKSRLEGKQLLIGIDSSKSNSAMSVGVLQPFTRQIENTIVFEFNGTKDGTREQDYFKLCMKEKIALSYLLNNTKVRVVGIEDTITKSIGQKVPKRKFVNGRWITVYEDGDDQYKGLDIHKSRMATSIMFANFNMFFLEAFQKESILVNVGVWKKETIPEEFRHRDSTEKESHRYLKTIDPRMENCSDDYTDSLCIMKYLQRYLRDVIEINDYKFEDESGYVLTLCDVGAMDEQNCIKYDKNLTFDQNCSRALYYTKEKFGTPRTSLLIDACDINHDKIDSSRLNVTQNDEKYVIIINEMGDTCYA